MSQPSSKKHIRRKRVRKLALERLKRMGAKVSGTEKKRLTERLRKIAPWVDPKSFFSSPEK